MICLQYYSLYRSIISDNKWLLNAIKCWSLDKSISDSLHVSNIFLFVIHPWCWVYWLPRQALPWHSTLTYHPGNPPLTLGIASGGQHGNCPTHSHLGGVSRSWVGHGPGAEAGWWKEALSVKSPTALFCSVWSTSNTACLSWKVIAVASAQLNYPLGRHWGTRSCAHHI